MAYAYGMRFDDDSNAITVINEENQTAVTTGYINGEYVEFGGNPNSVQTVTGTLANPWGNIDYAELRDALYAYNASAILDIDASALHVGHIISRPGASQTNIYTNGADVGNTVQASSAYEIAWTSDGEYAFASMIANDAIVSLDNYKNSLTTTLTIIWHPLPEE